MPETGTSVNGGNRSPRGNGEGVVQTSLLPNTCSFLFAPCELVDEFFESVLAPRDVWAARGQHPCCPPT
uniref:Uncharacterized protein n=1 Tax=Candidatus Kentrum sp. TC TaxID=2126339 RepID=A0A450ZDQ0_9GAMM|nr:MAG: hypothetical protein BECKTC1821D_GA0114238_11446 [Candidatus Kentron sp. TC]